MQTTLTPDDHAALIRIIRRAAADEIMPRFQNLAADQINTKSGPLDLVTEADTAAEAAMTAAIRARFPDALVVGEEAVAADPALRGQIAAAPLAFIIDPVDGTWNFAHGLPLFGVILAATHFGKPIFGLLHDPVMDNWIWAGAGMAPRQTYADGREVALQIAPAGPLIAQSGYLHINLMPQDRQARIAPNLPQMGRNYAMRCSCHEYRTLVQGAVGYVASATLNPWDHAAGVFLFQQGGGVARLRDGRSYDAGVTSGTLICAPDAAMWQDLADLLPD